MSGDTLPPSNVFMAHKLGTVVLGFAFCGRGIATLSEVVPIEAAKRQLQSLGAPPVSTHDPRQVIEDLRNHLAAHDRHLAFLLGAGTSCAVNVAPAPAPGTKPTHQPLVPGTDALTAVCRAEVEQLGAKHAAAWAAVHAQCEGNARPANVEAVLSKVRMKIDAMGEGETSAGLTRDELVVLERTLCAAIAKAVTPQDNAIPHLLPHHDLAAWVKKINRGLPLEIFTTNYDILIERALEMARVPVFDGFVGAYRPYFFPECIDNEDWLPGSQWVRLWKLHGSVNWLCDTGFDKRIVRVGPQVSGELILPSQRKYDESRKQPYVAYMDRLSRVLNSNHSLLITLGYGFGDEHINSILYSSLDNRSNANLVALCYGDLSSADGVVTAALRRPNLTVVGRNGGVISGVWGDWRLSQPVDNKTASFMDIAFDSNALPETSGSAAATTEHQLGQMRLGDFNWFCRFLQTLRADAP